MLNKILNIGIDFTNKKKIEIVRDIFIFFIVYCITGWIFEELVFLVEDHILYNRGFLFGPWLPIYGFGGIIITALFFKTKNKPVKIEKINIRPLIMYFEACIIATAVELIATYIIDFIGGNFKTLWDYSQNFMNFQGRIALIPDAKFGVIALLAIYGVQPILKKIIETKKQKMLNVFVVIIAILFAIDLIARIWLGSNFVG